MNIRDIDGAKPTEFTSKNTYRDYMNVEDIEGARPSIVKGYGGTKKEYERVFDSEKITKLPYAGISKKDGHNENSLFQMSQEQNSAADYIDFMRAKKHKVTNVYAGITNLGLMKKSKRKYTFQPPYGYGGNLSPSVTFGRVNRNVASSQSHHQYSNFMDQVNKPLHHSNSRQGQRSSYLGMTGNRILGKLEITEVLSSSLNRIILSRDRIVNF